MLQRGISAFELIVLSAVLIASGALIFPIVTSEIGRGDRAIAQEDCRRVAVALELYVKDFEPVPLDPLGGKRLHWMKGPGDAPKTNGFDDGGPHCRFDQLLKRKQRADGSPLTFLETIGVDPWGHAYLVNAQGFFDAKERIWVLSAGPNGVVETEPSSGTIGGDDVGRLLR